MPLTSCFYTVGIESVLPIGWRIFDQKSATALLYFGLDCILQKIYSRAILQRTIVDSSAFFERLRFVPIQPVCRRSRRIGWIFVWSGSELWSLFKHARLKLKNLKKPKAIDVLFKAYPMLPLACRSGRTVFKVQYSGIVDKNPWTSGMLIYEG